MPLLCPMVRKHQSKEECPIGSLSVVHHRSSLFYESLTNLTRERIDIFDVVPSTDLEADVEVIGVDEFEPRICAHFVDSELGEIQKVLRAGDESVSSVGAPEHPELQHICAATALK